MNNVLGFTNLREAGGCYENTIQTNVLEDKRGAKANECHDTTRKPNGKNTKTVPKANAFYL